MDQKNKGRARVKIAVFFVLAVHGIGLLALLMQGCRKDDSATTTTENTNTFTPPPLDTNIVTLTPTQDVIPTAPATNEVIAAATTEYTIAKNDTLSTIATAHRVTLKALMEANPGIEPTKLQLGQKIKIPPPGPLTPTTKPAVVEGAGGDLTYTVKSGDNLTTIATRHQTTVRAIRAANNLKTDSIKVGQKLIIPKAAPVPATGATNP